MEPIAITGFSFRLPQGAEDEDTFWSLLSEGRNVMTEWPKSRATVDSLLDEDHGIKNTLSSTGGHFLGEDPAAFDAPFFSISTQEAAAMDPQQRWILEVAYRAMENAGIAVERVAGTDTAVFAATMADDYLKLISKDPDEGPKTFSINTQPALLANRLSWYFNFTGPSIQLNTACSGSMIAMDLACSSLHRGQSSMALVAGSNALLTPESSLPLENMNFLSKDSLCYSFDHRANGYARGEGVAVLVLKRLSDAVRDNDVIRAVVRGSGSNQDGRTPGITQPSSASQEDLIRTVYRSCNLDFKLTRYVEAHGTGTQLGDAAEAKALGRVFRTVRSAKEPLYVGSVKTNIGHLEGASALAGILKSIMILEKGVIPPIALFEKLNPKINAKFNNLQIPTSCIPWPAAGLRRISINSFGFGGSNGHLILDDAFHTLEALDMSALTLIPAAFARTVPTASQETGRTISDFETGGPRVNGQHGVMVCGAAIDGEVGTNDGPGLVEHSTNSRAEGKDVPDNVPSDHRNLENPQAPKEGLALEAAETPPGFRLLIWSAKDEAALKRMLQAYSEYCDRSTSRSQDFTGPLAYTLSLRRSIMSWRSFAIVSSQATPDPWKLSHVKPVRSSQNPGGLAFVFTGQGAQYARMGLDLAVYPVFRATLSRCSDMIRKLGADWSLLDVLEDADRIHHPQTSQPLCTALQIALVELLREFGIVPDAVVGHSSGEIAAAYTAGGLSLESAIKVAYHRGRLAQNLFASTSKPGAMMSVNMPEADVDAYLDRFSLGDSISVACINSPFNITLSGDEAVINELQEHLDEDKIFARKLATGVAYHSSAMGKIAEEYHSSLGPLESRGPSDENILMVSSVTGLKVSSASVSRGQYWVENLVSPVRFAEALQYLAVAAPKVDGLKVSSTYIEVGPHAALKRPISDTLGEVRKGQNSVYLPVLSKFDSPVKSVLSVVGRLFALGHPVSVTAANQQTADAREWPFLVDTPAYPYNHSQLPWHETRLSRDWRLRKAAPRTVLGVRVVDWNPLEPRWRRMLRVEETPWLEHHVIGNNVLFPAAGMINMALEAVRQTASSSQDIAGYRIEEANFMKPIVIRPGSDNEVVTQLRPLQQPYEKAMLRFEIQFFTVVDGSWGEFSMFRIRIEYNEGPNEVDGAQESRLAAETMAREYSRTQETSTKPIKNLDFYTWGREQGLNWSGPFALAEDIRWDGDEMATLLVKSEPYEGIVHPGVLDSAFQLIYVPPSRGCSEKLPTIIPSKFLDIWIAATGWQGSQTRLLRAFGRSKIRPNGLGIECSVRILSESRLPLCHVGKAIMLPVMDHKHGEDGAGKRLVHRVDWKPYLPLLSVDQLSRHCNTGRSIVDQDFASDSARKLDRTVQSVFRHKLGRILEAECEKTPPHIKTHVAYMESWLHITSDKAAGTVDAEALKGDLEDLGTSNPLAKMLLEVDRNLISGVLGELDLPELLSSSTLMQDVYEDLVGRFLDHRLTSCLELIAHQAPALRILEVGAGLGAMTNLILSILERIEAGTGGTAFVEYFYTDVSDSSLEKAKERFKKHQSRMIFKVYNFERDIPTHVFGSEDFDVILAGGALHATMNLTAILPGLRSSLKPGGHLIFCQVTAQESFPLSFGFGVLPEWWSRKAESEPLVRRQILTEAQWDSVLKENGFSGTDLAIRDYEDEVAHCASIIISTAPRSSLAADDAARVLLMVSEGDDRQMKLAQLLSEQLPAPLRHRVVVVHFDQLKDARVSGTDYVVFLADLSASLLAGMSEPRLKLMKDLVGQLGNLLWITCTNTGTEATAGIQDGFLRTLRAEYNGKRIVGLSLEDVDMESSDLVSHISRVFTWAFETDSAEVEYVVRGDRILTGRLIGDVRLNDELSSLISPEAKTSPWLPGPPLKLHIESRGRLDTLHFREDSEHSADLGPTDVEIEAKAWAVNFRDVFGALGRLDDSGFGWDCAGIVTRTGSQCKLVRPGDRVCMFLRDCMRMFPRSDEQAVSKIPPPVSYEEACAIIIPGMTSWHALAELARLGRGEKVLIHAASGATGQLALQVAQMMGAEVFATVGYHDKKRLLMESFGIPEDHIFYSRSDNTTFAKAIMRMTDGYGVDVVLNSLVGQSLRDSWDCIAPYGRFVEMGKADINSNASLPMRAFANNAIFASVDIGHMIVQRPQMASAFFHKVTSMASEGSIHCPEPLYVYGVDAVEDAFRYLQSGKSTGRVIIRIDASAPVQKHLTGRRSWRFNEQASYLVVGGLGGIGRLILKWMASRGAKNLIVPSRSGPMSPAAAKIVSDLREQGITIVTPRCDVSSWESLSQEFETWRKTMPIIRGCINLAMALHDSVFENMSHTQWNQTIRSKVATSWNLHRLLTRVDFMVFFSSVSGIVGNPGQSNYAAACTFQDSLANHRTLHGLKTTSIALGVMRAVGVVAESEDLQRRLDGGAQGLGQVEEDELLALLNVCCDPAADENTPSSGQLVFGLQTPSDLLARGLEPLETMQRPLFSHFSRAPLASGGQNGVSDARNVNLAALFRKAETSEERSSVVEQVLAKRLARAMGIDAEDVDVEKPLHAYGVDSLVAIELRNWIAKDFAADVPVFELVGGRTVRGVAEFVEKCSQVVKRETKEEG